MKKSNPPSKFLMITFCTLFILGVSFAFYFQQFLQEQPRVGAQTFSVDGYEVAFGCTKTFSSVINPQYPPVTQEITYRGVPIIAVTIFMIAFCILLQVVCIILKIRKAPDNIRYVLCLVSAALTLFCGITVFFSAELFDQINDLTLDGFYTTGAITTGIFLISGAFITSLNAVDLFRRKKTA